MITTAIFWPKRFNNSTHSKSIFTNFFTSVTVIYHHNVSVPPLIPTQASFPGSEVCRTLCVLGLIAPPHSLCIYIEEGNSIPCPEFKKKNTPEI